MKLLTGLGASLIALVATGVMAKDLTVVSWGGAYTISQVEAYQKPWMAKTGKTIISEDYTGDVAPIKAQVEAKNVTWDLVDVELSDAMRLCDEGLIEPIDKAILPAAPDGTPAEKDFVEGALTDCAVASIVWSTVYAFDTTKFPTAPTTLADFYDLKKFPGKRGLRKTPKANLEMALIADGVAPGDVYKLLETEEGIARAFAKLDTIKSSVVWWEAGSQAPQLLADGEVTMTTAYNGRIFAAQVGEGKPFQIVWDGQILDFDLWVIPKGTPNKEAALDFIAYSTDTQRLADQSKWIAYGPARKSSAAFVGTYKDGKTAMGPHMPTAPDNLKTALTNNFEFWADNQDQLNERFTAWLAK